MVRTPCMRLPMSFVPPAVCDIFSNRPRGKKWQKASMWRMDLVLRYLGCGRDPVSSALVPRPSERPDEALAHIANARARAGAQSRAPRSINGRWCVWPWVPGLVEFTLGPREARTRGLARDTAATQFHNCLLASRAPSPSRLNLAHMIVGCTRR